MAMTVKPTKAALAEAARLLGKKGGSATTPAKAAAARRNGKLGGRRKEGA